MKIRATGIVICYNFNNEKFLKVEAICKKNGIRIKRPLSEDFIKPVGELVGFQNVEAEEGEVDFSEELMVLHNFFGNGLDKFLIELKSNELDIPYKAMLTETNKSWTAATLAKQIKLEHEQMNK